MDPYTNEVINQSMRDINRAGAIEGMGLAAQAVGAGAFGGSRQGVQRSELSRNVMDTKARTSADLRSQGFSQAMDRAGSAYEGQMGRIGSAGQAYGQLGQGLGSLAGQYGSLATSGLVQALVQAWPTWVSLVRLWLLTISTCCTVWAKTNKLNVKKSLMLNDRISIRI
jgi:hypothetical protein